MVSDDALTRDLQALGLSTLGSRVYLVLLQKDGWATGYEIAKTLGVARANVYDALGVLTRAGFAELRVSPAGSQYAAVPFASVGEAKIRNLTQRVQRLQETLPAAGHHPNIWQGIGWTAFRDQVGGVLKEARKLVQVGTSTLPIREVAEIVGRTLDPSVAVTYGCWDGCPSEGCGVCRPPVAALAPWTSEPACLLVIDDRLAVGSWGQKTAPTVVTTDYPAIVAGWRALVTP